ncbi:MAG: DUF983 domain-containing protein [Alphaproteobacteria bacterium]|nr:DUF983 domain-containing protein [Alphaproteobacteria bacterium]
MPDAPRPPVSMWRAGLLCRCPACGKGPLFTGFLTVAPRCRACGEDLAACEQGDGPAVFVILILGFIITGAALVVEVMFSPPYWLHVAIWPPLILGGALAMLRPFKGVLVATHFRHRRGHVER